METLQELAKKAVAFIEEARTKDYFSVRIHRKSDEPVDIMAVTKANFEWQGRVWEFLQALKPVNVTDLDPTLTDWEQVDWKEWLEYAIYHDNRYSQMCSSKSVESANVIINKYKGS